MNKFLGTLIVVCALIAAVHCEQQQQQRYQTFSLENPNRQLQCDVQEKKCNVKLMVEGGGGGDDDDKRTQRGQVECVDISSVAEDREKYCAFGDVSKIFESRLNDCGESNVMEQVQVWPRASSYFTRNSVKCKEEAEKSDDCLRSMRRAVCSYDCAVCEQPNICKSTCDEIRDHCSETMFDLECFGWLDDLCQSDDDQDTCTDLPFSNDYDQFIGYDGGGGDGGDEGDSDSATLLHMSMCALIVSMFALFFI